MVGRMQFEEKLWGRTAPLYARPFTSAFHASIKKGGYSSRHYHEHKNNEFYVVSGLLIVETYMDPAKQPYLTLRLTPGMKARIASGVWHRFVALEDTELLEIYDAASPETVEREDIVRHDQGGVDEQLCGYLP